VVANAAAAQVTLDEALAQVAADPVSRAAVGEMVQVQVVVDGMGSAPATLPTPAPNPMPAPTPMPTQPAAPVVQQQPAPEPAAAPTPAPVRVDTSA
jgi:hypothetical protein